MPADIFAKLSQALPQPISPSESISGERDDHAGSLLNQCCPLPVLNSAAAPFLRHCRPPPPPPFRSPDVRRLKKMVSKSISFHARDFDLGRRLRDDDLFKNGVDHHPVQKRRPSNIVNDLE